MQVKMADLADHVAERGGMSSFGWLRTPSNHYSPNIDDRLKLHESLVSYMFLANMDKLQRQRL